MSFLFTEHILVVNPGMLNVQDIEC